MKKIFLTTILATILFIGTINKSLADDCIKCGNICCNQGVETTENGINVYNVHHDSGSGYSVTDYTYNPSTNILIIRTDNKGEAQYIDKYENIELDDTREETVSVYNNNNQLISRTFTRYMPNSDDIISQSTETYTFDSSGKAVSGSLISQWGDGYIQSTKEFFRGDDGKLYNRWNQYSYDDDGYRLYSTVYLYNDEFKPISNITKYRDITSRYDYSGNLLSINGNEVTSHCSAADTNGICTKCNGTNFRLNDGECDRLRYTPTEAAAVLHNDNTNEITITFKK